MTDIDNRRVFFCIYTELPRLILSNQYCRRASISRITTISSRTWVQTVDRRRLKGIDEGRQVSLLSTNIYVFIQYLQVYLPAIAGLLPAEIVRSFSSFLNFCYLVRRNVIDESCLTIIGSTLQEYHKHREVFKFFGVRDDFNLPRQHSMKHYVDAIREFGAPNGLCSSITESKHIEAVKEPYRRSSRYKALDQMLITNQRLSKLAAFRQELSNNNMLSERLALPQRQQPSQQPKSPRSDVEAVDVPIFEGVVRLAQKRGSSLGFHCLLRFSIIVYNQQIRGTLYI
jgi:hypothetical protein